MDGRKIAKLLEEGYRMPIPQHVDEKLYEDCVVVVFFVAFSPTAVIFILNVLFAKEACAAKIKPVFFSEPAFLREILE